MHRIPACCLLTLAIAFAMSLQGCGQTGALYLPGDEQPSAVEAPEDEETPPEPDEGAT